MADIDELQRLVDRLKATRDKTPEWERQALALVWPARVMMFGALAFTVFNAWAASDVPLYAALQGLASAGLLIPATRRLIAAEANLFTVWKLADECAADLTKYTVQLELARAPQKEEQQ